MIIRSSRHLYAATSAWNVTCRSQRTRCSVRLSRTAAQHPHGKMNVGDVPVMNYGTARAAITGLALALGLASAPQSATALETASDDDGIHLGVTSCASTSCHAAASPVTGSSIRHDEYLVWSQESDAHRIDKHHRAYIVLLGDQGVRIAHNLGLPDAVTADACLNCHTDNVPEARRGPQFKIVDGVGCETCHGGAM